MQRHVGALAPQSALLARMKGHRVYIDANFLIYFFDRRAPYFDVIAPLFVACDHGEFAGFNSVRLPQLCLWERFSRDAPWWRSWRQSR